MSRAEPDLTVLVEAEGWADGAAALAEAAARRALTEPGLPPHDGRAIALVLADDETVQALNRQFRGKDKPTNVLSFPHDIPPGVPARAVPLGDVILAYETLIAESAALGRSWQHHLTHLVVHGILHILGLDHENETEALAMEAIERHILGSLGIADPYADPA